MVRPALLVLALLAGACASTRATPRPFPTPVPPVDATVPPPAVPPSADVLAPGLGPAAGAIVQTALRFLGTPYRNGGTDPSAGFDCSGLVWYVFGRHGVPVPRNVAEQYQTSEPIADDGPLEPGDLVFFSTVAAGPSHVGIALGGDRFVHAPSSTGHVRVERLSAAYWSSRYIGSRRVRPRSLAPCESSAACCCR